MSSAILTEDDFFGKAWDPVDAECSIDWSRWTDEPEPVPILDVGCDDAEAE